jgi:hypothetical protein
MAILRGSIGPSTSWWRRRETAAFERSDTIDHELPSLDDTLSAATRNGRVLTCCDPVRSGVRDGHRDATAQSMGIR